MKDYIVTIDGPAAAGKTTVSKMLAVKLKFKYVDTGALYRACALFMTETDIPFDNENLVCENLQSINIELEEDSIYLNGENVSHRIRTPEISMGASKISSYKCVRAFLLGLQKDIGAKKNAVFEGRDMGTSVFPNADFKFFLTGDVGVRAKRRFLELQGKSSQTYEEVLEDLKKRDHDDSTRELSPLKPAEDSHLVDSAELTPEEVVEKIYSIIHGEC